MRITDRASSMIFDALDALLASFADSCRKNFTKQQQLRA
jgi:hypothetical protein